MLHLPMSQRSRLAPRVLGSVGGSHLPHFSWSPTSLDNTISNGLARGLHNLIPTRKPPTESDNILHWLPATPLYLRWTLATAARCFFVTAGGGGGFLSATRAGGSAGAGLGRVAVAHRTHR